ncbi:MAG: hypothetical protein PHY47_00775 [Lachnospiraceae bacterium]|nr:hypothetical protein [Lachnospiraceae bacterium]
MVTTIGLMNKKIDVRHKEEQCIKCSGTGMVVIGVLPSNRIKGLKESGNVELTDDCDCTDGKRPVVIKRITRANRIKPIIIGE